ncbi:M48 family metalloprotease [Vulcanococcus limneticus]|uniref:M48 family metalloprotease n=1 Tax=Vulcanococcus limneticus TaxID=2170428 RepID=UPI00398C112E
MTVSATVGAGLYGERALAQQKPTDKFFEAAKQALTPDYYILYRIVDKLARANDIASGSWRVKVSEEYALNGFADEANLIVVPRPAMSQLSGDADALACMVGREISHHVRKHNAIGPGEQAAMRKQIQEEATAAAQSNENSKRGWGMGLGILGGVLGVNTGGIQSAVNTNTDRATAKMIAEKEAELNKRIAETAARIEKEADEDAFVYLARAGRDPKGCIRYLDVISRDPKAEPDPSNPQIPGRIQSYRDFIDRASAAKYKAEGNTYLSRSPKPLTYAIADNGASLRVDSTKGSTAKQIDSF